MRRLRRYWGLPFLCLLFGCGTDSNGLVGDWVSDMLPDRVLADQGTPLDSPVTASEPGDVDSKPYSIRLQFYANGRLDTVTALPMIRSHKSGKWRPVHQDESGRRATIECELMRQRTMHDIEWIDSDTIRLTPPNLAGLDLELIFRRTR